MLLLLKVEWGEREGALLERLRAAQLLSLLTVTKPHKRQGRSAKDGTEAPPTKSNMRKDLDSFDAPRVHKGENKAVGNLFKLTN